MDYRFGFNGQEKVNEIAGVGNHTTALFWEYDTRIARRWNLDPVDQISISNYAVMGLNPILNTDVLGDKVVNGDRLAANDQRGIVEKSKAQLKTFEKDHVLSEGMSKKDYLKSGGERSVWAEYTHMKKQLSRDQNLLTKYNARANFTEKVINRWKVASPNVFGEVDSRPEDFVLHTAPNIQWGETIFAYATSALTNSLVPRATYGPNRTPYSNGYGLRVTVDELVGINTPDDTRHGPQYTLNHEAGHFLYMVTHMEIYKAFVDRVSKQFGGLDGGHRRDDLSGEKAVEYGNKIDR